MHLMKRLALLISLTFPILIHSQDRNGTNKNEDPYSLSDHLVYGGNLGLSLGNFTNVGIAPLVGYKVTNRFIPGISASYDYVKIHYTGYPTQTSQTYGGSLWTNYFVLDNIFAHAEYEVLNGEWDPHYKPGVRYNQSSMLLGAGYRENFGGLSSYVMVLYDVTESPDSPYPIPFIIRVGFAEGL